MFHVRTVKVWESACESQIKTLTVALPLLWFYVCFYEWELDKSFRRESDISILSCTHSVILTLSSFTWARMLPVKLHRQGHWPPVCSRTQPSLRRGTKLSSDSGAFSPHRSEVKARQDVKPDFRHPPFTDYRQPPVDYRHPPVTDYRQPPTLDYRHPPGLLDFRQHPAAAQFPLGIPADFRPQVRLDPKLPAHTLNI